MKLEKREKSLAAQHALGRIIRSLEALLVALGMLTFMACGRSHNTSWGEASRSGELGPGAFAIDTVTATATVKLVDYRTRTLTLQFPNGSTETYKASNAVANFDQIHDGDRVRAEVAEALAVSLRKAEAPPNAGDTMTVALAPRGAKPGMFVANTVETAARIEDIDAANRMVTLQDTAGGLKTVKVASNVNLADLKKGDDVVARYTQALALFVEKP